MSKDTEIKFVGQPHLWPDIQGGFSGCSATFSKVWCMLIAQELMTVIPKMANMKKAFSVVATLVRIHLISLPDDNALLRNTKREYIKNRGRTGLHGQLQLLF